MKAKGATIFLLLIFAYTTWGVFYLKIWDRDRKVEKPIYWDPASYYEYLPATFIQHDLSFSFRDSVVNADTTTVYWPHILPNGRRVAKMTMGVAFAYAPFFAVAHTYASLSKVYPANGFSRPYQMAVVLSGLTAGLLGAWILFRLLRRFYPPWISAFSVCFLFLGTNLFNYCTLEAAYSHVFSFALTSGLCWFTFWIHQEPGNRKFAFFLGLILGWMIVIRPTNASCLFIPLLYGMQSVDYRKWKIKVLKEHYSSLLWAILGAFCIGFPQMLYWKYATGHWVFFSYLYESFYFDSDHFRIKEFLLSYRKGWWLYSPICFFALFGLWFQKEQPNAAPWVLPTLVVIPILVIVYSCWWTWWFGGGFGARPMVDIYPLLAFPIASILKFTWEKQKFVFTGLITLFLFFTIHNQIQTRQYWYRMISTDSMTKEAFWALGWEAENIPNQYARFRSPDYAKAIDGKLEDAECFPFD